VLLVANKLDMVRRRADVLPWLACRSATLRRVRAADRQARRRCGAAVRHLAPHLPEQAWFYGEDALTDRSERFLASELIREKLFRLTGDELPYSSTVVIDKYEEEDGAAAGPRRIAATIVVEREAHKGMVIGEGGERLKRIGSEARQDLERLLQARVFIEMWVKVRAGWASNEEHLRSYLGRGYDPLASEPVAVSELRVSHAALSFACRRPGTDAALSPPERVRALGSAAAICLGRGEAAHSLRLIAAARAELGRMPGASAADHRPLAVACNNMTWELHDRGDARTPGDTDAMLEIAAACRDHWRHAGTWLEVERADYGLAMTHLSARRADDAMRHAAQCLAACIAHEAAPYELFYGHEAMARVQHARGDTVACAHHRRAAQAAFDQLDADTQGGCRGSLDRLLALAPGA
jgi:hypothetical protein